jgi:protein-S-isoprenylcysteine O-methyltransferase Ste14
MSAAFMLVRHLFAIVVLPVTMTILIPRWLLSGYGIGAMWTADSAIGMIARIAGVMSFLAGLVLFGWSLYLFAARGRGTLAPWDPPRKLVVTGPYRYVRNPMISGVLLVIAGETLVHGSRTLGTWLLIFFVINQVQFLVMEEPMLEARFGEDYRKYKNNVPRWIPRMRPWRGMEN